MTDGPLLPKPRKRRWWFGPVAMVLGVVFSLILGEILMRVYVAARGWTPNCYATLDSFFVPDAHAGRTLRPGLRLRSSSYDITVNSCGLRGPEMAPAKPPGTVRIAVLGESSAFGYLVGDADDSCRILEACLQQHGLKVEVLNGGVPGFSMYQTIPRFAHTIAPLQPEIVILYLGWNDLLYLLSEDPANRQFKWQEPPSLGKRVLAHSTLWGLVQYRLFSGPGGRFAPPPDPDSSITKRGEEAFRNNLNQLLDTIQRHHARPVICTQLMAAQPGATADVKQFLGSDARQIERTTEFGVWISNELRNAGRDRDILVIDVQQSIPATSETLGDAIHPTRQGHRRIADCWCAALLPLLRGD